MKFEYTREIKDELLTGVGEEFGNGSNPIEAISAKFDELLDNALAHSVKKYDPDVVRKRQEYEAVLEQKKQETKETKEGEIKR